MIFPAGIGAGIPLRARTPASPKILMAKWTQHSTVPGRNVNMIERSEKSPHNATGGGEAELVGADRGVGVVEALDDLRAGMAEGVVEADGDDGVLRR